ncbi:hypothetical protein R4B61_00335 [Fructilactobacillus vespulae]|uniref:phage tail assembly chaperone n=1 Tax=Fructilactobacillus vespulae TaxID=1249630 RepID=UPI0039B5F36B
MADVKSWLLNKEDLNKEVTFKASDKLPEFKIRTITGTELDKLQRGATVTHKKRGQFTQETDNRKFVNLLIENTIVEPNLNDNEIQEYYGTVGNAAGTVRAMLTAGEYSALIEKIQEIEGFDAEENEIEEVKN